MGKIDEFTQAIHEFRKSMYTNFLEFLEWKSRRQEELERNTKSKAKLRAEKSIKELRKRKIPFRRVTEWHVEIDGKEKGPIDYWVSTGKYCVRKKKEYGVGLDNLL
jgi:hypothetical protein